MSKKYTAKWEGEKDLTTTKLSKVENSMTTK